MAVLQSTAKIPGAIPRVPTVGAVRWPQRTRTDVTRCPKPFMEARFTLAKPVSVKLIRARPIPGISLGETSRKLLCWRELGAMHAAIVFRSDDSLSHDSGHLRIPLLNCRCARYAHWQPGNPLASFPMASDEETEARRGSGGWIGKLAVNGWASGLEVPCVSPHERTGRDGLRVFRSAQEEREVRG